MHAKSLCWFFQIEFFSSRFRRSLPWRTVRSVLNFAYLNQPMQYCANAFRVLFISLLANFLDEIPNGMSPTKNNKVIRQTKEPRYYHHWVACFVGNRFIVSFIVVDLIKNNFFTFLFVSLSNYFWREHFSSDAFFSLMPFSLAFHWTGAEYLRANGTERPNGSEHQFYITANHVEMDMTQKQCDGARMRYRHTKRKEIKLAVRYLQPQKMWGLSSFLFPWTVFASAERQLELCSHENRVSLSLASFQRRKKQPKPIAKKRHVHNPAQITMNVSRKIRSISFIGKCQPNVFFFHSRLFFVRLSRYI